MSHESFVGVRCLCHSLSIDSLVKVERAFYIYISTPLSTSTYTSFRTPPFTTTPNPTNYMRADTIEATADPCARLETLKANFPRASPVVCGIYIEWSNLVFKSWNYGFCIVISYLDVFGL
jgi:hypothetical protein